MTAVDKNTTVATPATKTASTNLTTEKNSGLQTTETKKCRICGAPATGHAGISFFMDTGRSPDGQLIKSSCANKT